MEILDLYSCLRFFQNWLSLYMLFTEALGKFPSFINTELNQLQMD